MRCAGIVWMLLLLVTALPALRHASTPELGGAGHASIRHAPHSAPGIARTAAIVAVPAAIPAPLVVAVVLPAAPPTAPPGLSIPPLVPLRL